MRELVDLFTSEMPTKIANFEKAIAGEQLDELRRLAHQLKGAAGDDLLKGGAGKDHADGGLGTNTCEAEFTVAC